MTKQRLHVVKVAAAVFAACSLHAIVLMCCLMGVLLFRTHELHWPTVRLILGSTVVVGMQFGLLAAVFSLIFLRGVSVRVSVKWLAIGVATGASAGLLLSLLNHDPGMNIAFFIAGSIIGLVATCVRLWGAHRALPVSASV